jgi:CDP-diglyceride synthetase
MPVVALLLLIWALFGCAVVVLMIYGAFEHVAMNDAVMAAILATGTTFLASLATFLSWRRGRRPAGDRR